MSRTFEGSFEELLTAIRQCAEIGNPMPAKNANEKLEWLFQDRKSRGRVSSAGRRRRPDKLIYRSLLRPADERSQSRCLEVDGQDW
jgi:hypothetical protein